MNFAALNNFPILEKIGGVVGFQSVVVVIDVQKNRKGDYEIFQKNGSQKANITLENYLQKLSEIGVGEIVINSIDKDGTMSGYDLALVKIVRDSTDMPITVLGGAGQYSDFTKLIKINPIIGVAAGSLFVFKGVFRAVLINYPSYEEKLHIITEANKF